MEFRAKITSRDGRCIQTGYITEALAALSMKHNVQLIVENGTSEGEYVPGGNINPVPLALIPGCLKLGRPRLTNPLFLQFPRGLKRGDYLAWARVFSIVEVGLLIQDQRLNPLTDVEEIRKLFRCKVIQVNTAQLSRVQPKGKTEAA